MDTSERSVFFVTEEGTLKYFDEMDFITEEALREISPYDDEEFRTAMKRVLASPLVAVIARNYFPEIPVPDFLRFAAQLPTIEKFQEKIIGPAIASMLKQTSTGQTIAGLEGLDRSKKFTFVSNHRDILLDSAIFSRSAFLEGHGTPKICLGDNLLTDPWVVDLIKMNKGITVKRNLPPRELLKWSHVLSEAIRRQVRAGIDSVWIAQREGRAKDGNDHTHPGVIKMLTLTGDGSFLERAVAAHLVPVAISYEFDPNDIFKARELYITATEGSYHKAPGEDLQAMAEGIRGFKGRIHIQVGNEITEEVLNNQQGRSKSEQIHFVAEEIDRQIHANYRNWPSNYIAYDLLEGVTTMSENYSSGEKKEFLDRIGRMETRLAALSVPSGATEAIRRHCLEIYANPVRNGIASHQGKAMPTRRAK